MGGGPQDCLFPGRDVTGRLCPQTTRSWRLSPAVVVVFLPCFLPVSAVRMDLFQLLGQQSVAEGSGGDALKAGSASPCSWWLCWPVTRGTEAAASLALVPATEPAGLPNSNCDQLSFVLFSLFSPLCLRLSFVSGSAGSW